MELKPIKSKRDYHAALKEVKTLWNAKRGSKEADRLEVLVLLIERYEAKHFPIPNPVPIEFLIHVMDSRGMTRKDLEPYIGSRARVAEIFNRVRPLSPTSSGRNNSRAFPSCPGLSACLWPAVLH